MAHGNNLELVYDSLDKPYFSNEPHVMIAKKLKPWQMKRVG